jgi:hypothetical protein
MNHEIVHVVTYATVGHRQHSIIAEGLAHLLDGTDNSLPLSSPDLEALLVANSGRAERGQSMMFLGWLITTYGPDLVIELARAVPYNAGQSQMEEALEDALGMGIDAIIEQYESEVAWRYPELPALEQPSASMAEMLAGIDLTFDCENDQTEGRSTETRVWQSVDFRADLDGFYIFPHPDVTMTVSGVYEALGYEENPPAWPVGTWGIDEHLYYLEAGRRYRVRSEVSYPGPVEFTLRMTPEDVP